MLIGLVYDLRSEYLAAGYSELDTAEFDRDDTIDAIENALRSLGHDVDRVGSGRALVGRLAAGDRWDLVFNVAEGLSGFAREAQVPALLEMFSIPCTFADAHALAVCHHKGTAKRVVLSHGLRTPAFAEIDDPEDEGQFAAAERLGFPLFAKPVAEGTGKGVSALSVARDGRALRKVVRTIVEEHGQPALVETFLAGREFTVGILGTGRRARVVGTVEVVLRDGAEAEAYSYHNKENCEDLVTYRPTDDRDSRTAAELALLCWRVLGGRDGGRVDIRCDEGGEPYFLEVNPLAGLHPEHSDLPILWSMGGGSYVDLIGEMVASARRRCTL